MKKLLYISVILIGLVSFTGCYGDQAVVYGPPPRRVIVAPGPYYYHPAPVIVERYGHSRHRGWRHGHVRY